jgi:hypothetical protein
VRNGRQPGSWIAVSRELSSARAAVTRVSERGKLKNLHCFKSVARKRLVETEID